MNRIIKAVIITFILLIFVLIIALGITLFNAKKGKAFYAEDFNIKVVLSDKDCDNDGIDDYTDIMLGARADAKNKPKYKSAYYSGGYPPDNEGVCTDVIWRAFKNAGYNLKDMVDEDIKNNVEAYPRVNGQPDPNIDFRRVPNLKVYFERNAINLTTDLNEIEEWQPGDIVVFGTSHIGIISDKRNVRGVPYLIHNSGQPLREENVLEALNAWQLISGHYRFK